MSLSQFKIQLMEAAKVAGIKHCSLTIPEEFHNTETLLTTMLLTGIEDKDKRNNSDLIIHRIIQLGRIELIKKELLVPEVLLARNSFLKTSLGLIIQRGQTKEIPKDLLTEEILLSKDDNGTTHLHLLATYDQLSAIDPKFLTKKFLTIQNKSGLAPIHLVKNFDIIPKKILTEELILLKDRNGQSTLHHAVLNQTLGMLIRTKGDIINQKSILAKDCNKVTPAHLAAEAGILWQLPRELINKKALEAKDQAGNTIMHYVAKGGRTFRAVPTKYLTKEYLCKPNNWDLSPLELAVNTDPNCLQTIPIDNLKLKDLFEILEATDSNKLKEWSKTSIRKKEELEELKKRIKSRTHEGDLTL